jgi:hypothetical protein
MTFLKLIAFLSFMSAVYMTASVNADVDLTLIVGKNEAQIQSVLGKPTSEDYYDVLRKTCKCKRTLYKEGLIAITFVNGKSDWIWVYHGINLLNIDVARIKQYHKFKDFTLVKVATVNHDLCCPVVF